MHCQDIMQRRVATLGPDATIRAAARLMLTENIGFVPIVGAGRRVLGVVTDRDIALRAVAADRSPDAPVAEIMTRDVVACRPGDDARRAEELMARNQKSRIVVCRPSGYLEGVISLPDVVLHEKNRAAARLLRAITKREVVPPRVVRPARPAEAAAVVAPERRRLARERQRGRAGRGRGGAAPAARARRLVKARRRGIEKVLRRAAAARAGGHGPGHGGRSTRGAVKGSPGARRKIAAREGAKRARGERGGRSGAPPEAGGTARPAR
jgi:CBS domain-containing protein